VAWGQAEWPGVRLGGQGSGWVARGQAEWPGFPVFTDKEIQDFSTIFQDPHDKFSRTFSEPVNV